MKSDLQGQTTLDATEDMIMPIDADPAGIALRGARADSIKRVLLVDDDEDIRDLLVWALVENGYEVAAVDRGARALEMLSLASFDALVIDLRLPDMNGAEVLRQMRGLDIAMPTVVISGYADCPGASRLRELGVHDILYKPFQIPTLLQQVRVAMADAPANRAKAPTGE